MTQNIACNDASLITSIDGVTIAMHDFGGTGSPVLLSHATGFHGHCWEPVAHALNSQHHVVALDHRGYGDAETVDPTTMTWDQYGLDALAAARHLYAQHNEPIIGIGHSMGGASLLMAAHSEPHLFKALFVFEPIVFPPPDPDAGGPQWPAGRPIRRRPDCRPAGDPRPGAHSGAGWGGRRAPGERFRPGARVGESPRRALKAGWPSWERAKPAQRLETCLGPGPGRQV